MLASRRRSSRHPRRDAYSGLGICTTLARRCNCGVLLAPCREALAAAAAQICRDPPGFDRVAFHRAFHQSLVDFFTTDLRGR